MPDHVHMLLSIPPKHAVSQVVGYIKGKSAIHMARVYGERKRNFVGQHFWARGFFVNTVGRDEEAIRAYIRNQEKEDQRLNLLTVLAHVGHASVQEFQKILIREVGSRSELALAARLFGKSWPARIGRPDLNRPQARRPK